MLAGERIIGEVLQLKVDRVKEVDVELRPTREGLLTRADQVEETFPLFEPIVEMSEEEDDEASVVTRTGTRRCSRRIVRQPWLRDQPFGRAFDWVKAEPECELAFVPMTVNRKAN